MIHPFPLHRSAFRALRQPAFWILLLCALIFSGCSKRQLSQPGDHAPDAQLQDENGDTRSLSDFKGAALLVYFYPKDDTPGCTTEACALRDAWDAYKDAGIRIVGVSADSVESHAKFAEKHELPFTLLSDPDAELADAFGVPKRMGFFGRVSFLLDDNQTIRAVYPDVDPAVHAQEVLKDAEELGLTEPGEL